MAGVGVHHGLRLVDHVGYAGIKVLLTRHKAVLEAVNDPISQVVQDGVIQGEGFHTARCPGGHAPGLTLNVLHVIGTGVTVLVIQLAGQIDHLLDGPLALLVLVLGLHHP